MDWNDELEYQQEHDPLSPADKRWLAHDDFRRPAEVLGQQLASARAQLELANERVFFLASEVSRLNAIVGNTQFQTEARP